MSTSLVDNLGLKRTILPQAMVLQMAVQGSRSKINATATVEFAYSTIKCEKTFDIINIATYDMILGIPFIWQHKILVGMNPTRIAIGSVDPIKVSGGEAHTIMGAMAMKAENGLEQVREMLRGEAKGLCEDALTSALPPFRAINHHIPLIDDSKIYKFRPSKCPRALEPIWREKSNEYLSSGRWRIATGSNPIPLLLIQKPRKNPEDPIKLRACFDKRQQNSNTKKLASPLPDQTEVLERIAGRRFRSVIDGRDAYEQIRVVEEDVKKTLFNTPDGLMESLVLQQGDCNGPATYQTLMNHLFAGYIGVWMDVYLDDIMIYSDTIEDHIKHVRTVFKILKREKLFLNPKKMQFLAPELEVLGHRITDEGIMMDPHKVDAISKWPTPTNKDLLASFIGAVGYLADGVRGIRIPMAVLNKITGSTKLWRWGPTEQRSFEQVKSLVEEHRHQTRVPLDYSKGAPKIWLVTDASLTGAAGHVCQGADWKTAKPVSFWSGKFSSAEQAYPTHEQELLAIVESLKRFRHHLLGTNFIIVTDHERLESIMTQKDLSRRQTRWLETLNDFDFEIIYSPGKLNTFADALSRIYSNDGNGTERAPSEYVSRMSETDEETSHIGLFNIELPRARSNPVIVGKEVEAKMLLLMATAKSQRKNPTRGKMIKSNLMESESDSSVSDSESIATLENEKPKKGRGRPRKSVPVKPNNSFEFDSESEEERVAPAPSDATEWSPTAPNPAKSYTRPGYDSDDDGESEAGGPRNPDIITTLKRDFERVMKLPKKSTMPAHPQVYEDSEGESKMEEPVRTKDAKKDIVEANIGPKATEEPLGVVTEVPREKTTGAKEMTIEQSLEVKLTDVIKEVEFPGDLRGLYTEDKFFKVVLLNPDDYANFEVIGDKGNEIIYLKDTDRRVLCIPNVKIGSRNAREIMISHAHSILAHLGARKTLWYLRENVWWKNMIKDITDFCGSCDVCARTKPSNQKPMGLLHPLKVPTRPWEQIGVDFVGPLPEAKNRYGAFDQVMVVIDHLRSMVHLIPTKINYRARQIAEIFYDTIYKLHGLPERIISDRDKIFTSIFWQNLHRLMNIDLKLSSTYHPQTDGATEHANRTMVQMIRQAIGERDSRWIEKLPSIEWAMNAARSETTGFSPFFLNYGHRPRPLLWNNSERDEYPGVHAFAQRIKDAIMKAHDAILEKRVKQTCLANKSRKASPIVEGDNVYLSTKNIKLPKGKTRKLIPKYIGPYKVLKAIVPGTTYQLDLPDELKAQGIHNAFHASLLRVYVPSCNTRFPGRQFAQLAAFGVADEQWEVEKIMSHIGKGDDSTFELIWTNGETTWEPYNRVKGLEALVEYLEAMGVSSINRLPKGRGNPPPDDAEAYVASMEAVRFETEEDISWGEARAKFLSNSPPTSLTLYKPYTSNHEMIPTFNSQYDVAFDAPTRNFRVQRRSGTPYPKDNRVRPLSAPPIIRTSRHNILDVSTAVAAAGTTLEVGEAIRSAVRSLTPAKKAKVIRALEQHPARFFKEINIRDILKRTVHSAEGNSTSTTAASADTATAEPAAIATPKQDSVAELLPLIKQILTIMNNQALIIQGNVAGQGGVPGPILTDPRVKIPPPPIVPVVPIYGIDDVFGKPEDMMEWDREEGIDVLETELEFFKNGELTSDEVVPLTKIETL